jgi:hypothetical protein
MSKREEENRAEFVSSAEAMYERMVKWRDENPEASFDEIASQVGDERRQLMGQLLEELATQHAAEVEALEFECPECAGKSEGKGRQKREVTHQEGDTKLRRGYRYCARCGSGFFPPRPKAETGQA